MSRRGAISPSGKRRSIASRNRPSQRPRRAAAAGHVPGRGPAARAEPIENDAEGARTLAASAQSLDELRAVLDGGDGRGPELAATEVVGVDGNLERDIKLVGEDAGR